MNPSSAFRSALPRAAGNPGFFSIAQQETLISRGRTFSSTPIDLAKKYRKRPDSLVVQLTQPIAGLGTTNDIVNVKPGRMRRDLFPNRQAVYIPWKTRSELVTQRKIASSASNGAAASDAKPPSSPSSSSTSVPIGKIEPKLAMTFTCTVEKCGHRSTHEFSKKSYQKGIVLVQCPSCKNRHLIADHLGWFKESTSDGKHATIEDILAARGESITKARLNPDGTIEYNPESTSSTTIPLPLRPISDIQATLASIPQTIKIESVVTPNSKKLYGSVGVQDVMEAIKQETGANLEDIHLEFVGLEEGGDRVREVGSYNVRLSAKGFPQGTEVEETRVVEVVHKASA